MKSEQLGSGERWVCDRCQSQQQAVKQMSIRRLPPVMCLHIKRFEHRRLNGVAAKVDTPLVFPVDSLDMAPFTSSAVLRARYSARSGPAAASGAPGGLLYELYAVVSHRGNLEGGHYITYLRVGRPQRTGTHGTSAARRSIFTYFRGRMGVGVWVWLRVLWSAPAGCPTSA